MENCFRTASHIADAVEDHTISGIRKFVSHHTSFNTLIVATGKQGNAPGEFYLPCGIAIRGDTHEIFVANYMNGRVEVFSEVGEFLYQLGEGQLFHPSGIAVYGDSVYISSSDHTVSKISLINMSIVVTIGGYGSDNGLFLFPNQLTTDINGRVFVADVGNDRISVHDSNLAHIRNIMHQSMSQPRDVKVSREFLYVLCPDNNQCILILNLEGDKLLSLITCGKGKDVLFPLFFGFDPLNNFVVSDHKTHSIRVFSTEGNLLYTIGSEGHRHRNFKQPTGLAISPNGRLVCASYNFNYGLQIFY